jgi:hypothetical protein
MTQIKMLNTFRKLPTNRQGETTYYSSLAPKYNSMELSPSWEAANCSYSRTSQHFKEPEGSLRCSQEPSPLVHILSQINLVHTTPSYILIFLFSGFLTKILYAFFWCLCVLITCPSHPPWPDHSNYTWRRVQITKLLIMQFSPTSRHFISLRSSTLFSDTLILCSSLNIRDKVSHPYRTTVKIIVLYIITLSYFLILPL